MKKKFIVASFAALVSVSVMGATGYVSANSPRASGLALAADPCAPDLEPPPPPDPGDPKAPGAPKNLRILGSGGGDAAFDEPEFDLRSGPNAWDEGTEAAAVAASHLYFDMLTARADCLTSFHFRTQANIDLVASRADGDNKIPIVYHASQDAAKFEIDPSASLPNSGSTGTPQKRLPLNVQGATSMLITWDLKIAESMRWMDPDGLGQHKAYRLDEPGASNWVGMKQSYDRATKGGLGIAHFFMTAPARFMGPGTTRGKSETITPYVGEFYIQPDTWTRVWVFLEGNIGIGDNAVKMSVWLADENRAPFQMYDRVNMVAPEGGIALFRYEFDSSTKQASNGPGQQYQRNFVTLKGTTLAGVTSLLQKPLK